MTGLPSSAMRSTNSISWALAIRILVGGLPFFDLDIDVNKELKRYM
jgi:hypothetical protein